MTALYSPECPAGRLAILDRIAEVDQLSSSQTRRPCSPPEVVPDGTMVKITTRSCMMARTLGGPGWSSYRNPGSVSNDQIPAPCSRVPLLAKVIVVDAHCTMVGRR